MKKRLRILALYRTAELKKNIAGILDNENAFYTTYAFLDSGDICQLSAEKDPDIILLEASADKDGHSTIAYGRELRLRTCAQLLILGPSKDRAAVIETSTQTFASGYISPEQIPFLHQIICETWRGDTPQKILIRELILSFLTEAEIKVLEILLGARDDLLSSPKTIANQKTSIFHKLGLKNLQELQHIFWHY